MYKCRLCVAGREAIYPITGITESLTAHGVFTETAVKLCLVLVNNCCGLKNRVGPPHSSPSRRIRCTAALVYPRKTWQ